MSAEEKLRRVTAALAEFEHEMVNAPGWLSGREVIRHLQPVLQLLGEPDMPVMPPEGK